MAVVIHMHQSPDISKAATWSTVNVICNTLFDILSLLGFAQYGEQQQLQRCWLARAECSASPPPALLHELPFSSPTKRCQKEDEDNHIRKGMKDSL